MATYVLVHGAYQGGWIWKFVSERLRAKGHNVLAPTLDGCAERTAGLRAGITTETHGEEIAKLLYFHDLKKAVLVGTSSGAALAACFAVARRLQEGKKGRQGEIIVTVFPDSGDKYLSERFWEEGEW